jgi:predicted nucleic acid-binding protein
VIVVDCSVVVDALLASDAEDLDELLSNHRLAAPHLIDAEVVAAVRHLVLGHHVDAGRGEDALTDYDQLAITRWGAAGDLRRPAFDLRDTISAHDATYVALAEALDCPLTTRDRRLARAASALVDVIVA